MDIIQEINESSLSSYKFKITSFSLSLMTNRTVSGCITVDTVYETRANDEEGEDASE